MNAVAAPPLTDRAVSAPAVPDDRSHDHGSSDPAVPTEPVVRLRPGVLALPTPAGISFLAPAMGPEASLVMEGPAALHQLWDLVAASWQDGVPEGALDALPVPDGARRVLRHWWDELTARRLLVPADRLLGEVAAGVGGVGGVVGVDDLSAARGQAVRDRLDASAADPVRAWSALRCGRVVLVAASTGEATEGVVRTLAKALETGGVGAVRTDPASGDPASGGPASRDSVAGDEVRLVVDLDGRAGDADLAVLDSRVVVADPARDPGDRAVARVREAMALRAGVGPATGRRSPSTVQLALGVAALAQRTVGLLAGLPDPHRGEVVVVEDDGPVVRYARPSPAVVRPPSHESITLSGADDLDRLLDGAHWLSDDVLGPVEVPSPGDLEQVPSPRARGSVHGPGAVVVHGLGATARDARVEVALAQLAVLATRDHLPLASAGVSTVLCRGRDPQAMIADALARMLVAHADADDHLAAETEVGEPRPGGTRVHVVETPALRTEAAARRAVPMPVHLVTVHHGADLVGAAIGCHRAETIARAVQRAEAVLDPAYDVVPRPVLDPVAPDPVADWTSGALAALASAGVVLRLEPATFRGHPLPGVAWAHLQPLGADR